MPAQSIKVPSYGLHKASGQARVILNGKSCYLGPYGSVESRRKYTRLITEWEAGSRCSSPSPSAPDPSRPPRLTIDELIVAYMEFAKAYYVKNGRPTDEQGSIRQALRPLHELYGSTFVPDFGPLALKSVRERMIQSDLCRTHINKSIGRVKRLFGWGVENELVPANVFHGLQAVKGLRYGRSAARESKPVRPVPASHVLAVLPRVSRQIRAMIELQELTGMRPGEVTQMRTIDLDMTGRLWVYTPMEHKTEHHAIARKIYLGPRAQEVVRPFLKSDVMAFLFSPAEAEAERNAQRRLNRKTPMTPSQARRRPKCHRQRMPQDRYSRDSYRIAIARACKVARVPRWHPHQLRHNAATRLRKEFGIEAARVVLGHSSLATTEIYAEIDQMKAAEIMAKVG